MPSPLRDRAITLLRWSERYTKTDMVYIATGGWWLGLAQAAGALAGLVLTITFANLLTPEVFGEYRFLMTGLLILSVFMLPGMHTAILESTPKGFLGNLPAAFRAMTRWGTFGALIALGVATYYFLQGNIGLAFGFTIIAAALPLFDSSTIYLDFLKSLKEFKKVALYSTATRVVMLAVSAAIAYLYPDYAFVILAAFFLGNSIPSVFFYWKTRSAFVPADAPSDPGLARYAWHLSAMAALGLIASQLDKVLVWDSFGAEQLAIFYIANVIPQELARVSDIIFTLAVPKLVAGGRAVSRSALVSKMLKYTLAMGAVVAAYIILCPIIFDILFPRYAEAVTYSQVLALVVIGTTSSPMFAYLTAHKATRALYVFSILPPAVRIIASIVLILPFGLWGAVYASLIGAVASVVLLAYLFYSARTPDDSPPALSPTSDEIMRT